MSKKCPYLWSHVRMHVDGNVLPCCIYDATKIPGNFEVPKVSDGIQNAFESELFNDVRHRMDNDGELPECHKCWYAEKYGGDSLRTRAFESFGEYIDKPRKIRYIETALSTHCNLACRMCNDKFSSKWKLLNNPKQSVDTTIDNFDSSNYDADLSELKLIKLVGGEPMIDKNHVHFLQMLFDKSDDPTQVELYYNTNGTVLPNAEILEFWKKVKSVHILFSIDGIEEINEILRPPHKWSTILKTIEYFKSQSDINFKFDMHTVISVLNIKHMKSLMGFAIENFGSLPEVEMLLYPEHLALNNLHTDYKKEIIQFVEDNYLGLGFDPVPLVDFINSDTKFSYTKDTVVEKEKFITERLATKSVSGLL